jgi:ABC-2 type transport system ATP-binding protein
MPKKALEAPVLEAKKVVKSFGNLRAVQEVDLLIQQGEAVALLGPNGAGKTTLVEMLEGLQEPDGGEILLFGKPWKGHEDELRSRIGLCLQETRLADNLHVDETLELFAALYQLPRSRVGEVIELVHLQDKRQSKTSQLSGGQRQKLAVGLGLLNDPELLLLDEPTTGLDPQARQELWELIRQLQKRGHSLLLTTHYMEEAESLCQRVVFMSKGRILTDAPLQQLKRRHKRLDRLFVELSGEALDA